MGIFRGFDANLPTQLWIIARYMESLSLLIAPFVLRRKLNHPLVLTAYGAVTLLLLVSVFHWRVFPDCFIEGSGLTPFKIMSEYVIMLLLSVGLALLLRNRRGFERDVLWMLAGSIVLTIFAELFFTFYISVYGLSNLLGHFLTLISFYFMYRAIIVTGMTRPQDLLFRNLAQSEAALKRAKEGLEATVAERTAELTRTNERLAAELNERKLSEEAARASEERFRDFYENAPNAYFSLGADGLIRRCNRRGGELLGYTVEELVGRPVPDLYADTVHGKEKAKQLLQRFRAGETVRNEELQMQKADGTPVWISLTVNAVRDAQGRVVESRSMVVDITERKRLQNIMRARLRLLELANLYSLDELLTATLDEIEALTGSTLGFYHFLEPDQRTLSLQSWSTNTLKNMCTAAGKGSHYDVAQAGVWVDCIHQQGPVIHNDYALLPHRKGMPEGHAPVVREAVVPIFRGDLIRAIIGVGNKSRNYDEGDIEIISQLGDLSWDIVERKRSEEALHRLNRELRAVSECNQILVRAVDEQTLVKDICRVICEEAGYRLAWVGYAEQDEAKTVRPVAWTGVVDGYLTSANMSWADTAERGRGPVATAIRTGATVCIEDFATDSRVAPWREDALRQGHRCALALPLKDEKAGVVGARVCF
jgi:PAS domain S-box-containing protein